MISYNPLWKTLIDKDKKRMDLLDIAGISRGTLAKMGKNEPVNLKVIDSICVNLECKIQDVIEIISWDFFEMLNQIECVDYMEIKQKYGLSPDYV